MGRKPQQIELAFHTHGGARPGAGRKPKGSRAGAPHDRRARVDPRQPLLVTFRVRRGVPNLRSQAAMKVLRTAFAAARARFGLRLVHFSVQSNHVHLVAEAEGKRALWRGMQGLAIRIARNLNGAVGRRGAVLAERYHARSLATPREVRSALAYVLLNRQRHGGGYRVRFVGSAVDPCSSGDVFDGWVPGFDASPRAGPGSDAATVPPKTWLLEHGWRRRGLIRPDEVPGPKAG